jgi:hypothetical protein
MSTFASFDGTKLEIGAFLERIDESAATATQG